ncbi:unnamed protein product [Didymodactylos carnosus]|uniref:ADP ribosyltransferase domain-containing protein n=1 Tax=Didymodactylos carnosus TaxID=1234261 RepID=A0A814W4Q0_9BILA|nr:unnamed protein product [Didymodactylos carnosus]CAF1199217.1 unnamed protein product [Didymodactylos carnosus]CAF3804402.1 unnamed protein product [Didymodactylos carnosus]CAF3963847.1 unnamed protein product [Didymodactylos carnosus]
MTFHMLTISMVTSVVILIDCHYAEKLRAKLFKKKLEDSATETTSSNNEALLELSVSLHNVTSSKVTFAYNTTSKAAKNDIQRRRFFDREQINLESHQLVWLGHLVTLTIENLRKVIDYVKVFDNAKECLTYIEEAKLSTIFLVIPSSESGELFISQITDFKNIWSVIVYDFEANHSEWISNHSKIKCVCKDPDQLLCDLKVDVLQYKKYKNNGIFNDPGKEDNTTDDAIESWWITYMNVLIYLSYPDRFHHKLVDSLRTYYDGKESELKILDEFEKEYKPDRAVWWYTRNTFLYSILNRALRQHNIEVMFLFGFFVQDLYRQVQTEYERLKLRHSTEPRINVYRGQIMSRKEINELNSDFNIINNGLLSTSPDRQLALFFLPEADQMEDSSYERVLFEIEIDIRRQSRPYADISHLSQFSGELEILFMMGTPFKIVRQNGISYDENEKLWTVKLQLTRDEFLVDDRVVESLTCDSQRLKMCLTPLSDSLQFASIADINLIFDIFCDLYPQEEKWINALRFHCIGRYQSWPENNIIAALSYYSKALQTWNNESNYCSINIGQIHHDIARCYSKDVIRNSSMSSKSFNLAIESYIKAIGETTTEIEQIDIYEKLSQLYMNIGDNLNVIQYKELQVQYTLKYYSSIDDEKCAISLNSLAFLYEKIKRYDNALTNYEKALKILLESIVSHSSWWIITICNNLIKIYNEQKDDYNSTLKYELIKNEYVLKDNEGTNDSTS